MTAPHSPHISLAAAQSRRRQAHDDYIEEEKLRKLRKCEISQYHVNAGFPLALSDGVTERQFYAAGNVGRSNGILLCDRRFVFAVLPKCDSRGSDQGWMTVDFASLHTWLAYPADSLGCPTTAYRSRIFWQPVGHFSQLTRESLTAEIEQIGGLARVLHKRRGRWIRNRLSSPIKYLPDLIIPGKVPAALLT